MNQTLERSRVKARIRALAEKTTSNGCTEAEALSAAEMVGRLLERYALTMEQVDLRKTPCVQLEVFAGRQRRRPIDGCVVAVPASAIARSGLIVASWVSATCSLALRPMLCSRGACSA